MKKRTCKILLWVGVIILILSFLYSMLTALWPVTNKHSAWYDWITGLLFSALNPIGMIGIILVLIALVYRNSEEQEIKITRWWVKWGFWVVVIGLILFFISIGLLYLDMFLNRCAGECVMKLSFIGVLAYTLFEFLMWPASRFTFLEVYNGMEEYVYKSLALILPFLKLFLIGILLGFIIRKIKKSH